MTPLRRMRKDAPGSITLEQLVAVFERKRYPRSLAALSAFERGEVREPEDRFLKIWADAVGASVESVRKALRRTPERKQRRSLPAEQVA